MKLISFTAENFKGIEKITLRLDDTPNSNVYCFVGLNESGKTTVLEALDAYKGWTETLKPVTAKSSQTLLKKGFIPKSRLSNFTGTISITIECALEPYDTDLIRRTATEAGYVCDSHSPTVTRIQRYVFEDSEYLRDENRFTLEVSGYKTGSRSKRVTSLPESVSKQIVIALNKHLPAVLYFPNALFETPDSICLDEGDSSTEKDAYYRKVLQDILDSLSQDLDLEKHITRRIGNQDQRDALDNTVRKLEGEISRVVFGAWKDILGSDLTQKQIALQPEQIGGERHLRIRYKDGADSYVISERSMGFRWFFGFLLLTQFRKARQFDQNQVIYVFDEPASNLHSSAQGKLLRLFGTLAKASPVIYSTHSHHLINPEWLENVFVVKNDGMTYRDEEANYNAQSTKITVEKYRSFVSSHPDQVTYFQPILDVLEYRPSALELVPHVCFVEGKNDYYAMRLVQGQLGANSIASQLKLVPGNGAGGLDAVIRLYIGWGASCQVLLDSDKAGSEAKEQFEKKYGALLRGHVHLLSDLCPEHSGSMESMFSEADKSSILAATGHGGEQAKKKLFNRCLQEACARGLEISLDTGTKNRFSALLEALAS